MTGASIKEEQSQRSGSVKSDNSAKESKKTEAEKYSKMIKLGKVETFDWKFEEKLWDSKKGKFQMQTQKLEKIEAIYINPKWKKSQVGDFLTYGKKKKSSQSQKKIVDAKASDSSDDEKIPIHSQSGGVTIEDFKKLKIPDDVMKDGMLFIWVEKEYIMDIVRHLETQNFFYVENVCYVMLNQKMEKGKFLL